jgi:hypothetical protein
MVRALAGLLLIAGLAGLHRAWRDRRIAPHRLLVAASWLALAAAVAVWSVTVNADIAVPQAVTLAMLLGLAAVAAQAFTLRPSARVARDGGALEPASRPAKTANRIARLTGSLLLVPLLGLVAGLAWFAWVPGREADRLMGEAFAALLAAAIGLVALLASTRPMRMLAILAAVTLALAGALMPALAR